MKSASAGLLTHCRVPKYTWR